MNDEALPLETIDRLLSPIRRVAAFGVEHPTQQRFVEHNLDRWLQPLLAIPLPDSLREHVLTVAGQVSGFDDADDGLERWITIRTHLRQLDQVLGLPLVGRSRRAERTRRKPEPVQERAPRQERSKRSRKRGARKEPVEVADSVEPESPREEERREARPSRRGWNGDLSTALEDLGLPSAVASRLAAAGLRSAGDVLYRAPLSAETLKVEGAGRQLDSGRVAVGGRNVLTWTTIAPDGTQITRATLRGQGDTPLTWVDADRAAAWRESVRPGQRAVVVGEWTGDVLQDAVLTSAEGRSLRMCRYAVSGVSDDEIRLVLSKLLPWLDRIRDPLPPTYRQAHLGLAEAFAALHGLGDSSAATQRLAFDESVATALATGFAAQSDTKPRGIQHAVVHSSMARLLDAADAKLSDAQELELDAIKRDLRSSRPTRRVLFGEPGGGKGLLAVCAAALVAESKAQVAFTSNDPVLLEQRFAFAQPLLEAAGLVSRHISKLDEGARDSLKRGQVHVVFGGPEIIDADVEYRRLGLVVASDDQLSIASRLSTRAAPLPDLLVVPTGTPSAAALIVGWAGFALSRLEGAPRPDVLVKTSNQRVSAYAAARHALLDNAQVAVLFPLIDGRDALDPAEASRVMNALAADALPGARLSLYHGAMPRKERLKTYRDFRHRRADALLATTAMEESAPVPGLEVAVVEHAQKMSPSRLARLAGLGVRHVCLVVSEDTSEVAIERMKTAVLEGWSTPFPKEGLPALEHVDLESNGTDTLSMIVEARDLAVRILTTDAQLRNGSHAELIRMTRNRWPVWYGEAPCPLPEPGQGNAQRKRRRRRRRR